jgi:hypothetical protein
MTDPTMRDVLDRLDTQEKELAQLRTSRTRRTRLPGTGKSRKVAVGILALLMALVPLSIFAANPFADFSTAAPVHQPNIDTAYNLGITTGFNNPEDPSTRLYYPKENVTREEMASFLIRTASLNRMESVSAPGAGPDKDLGAGPSKQYMQLTLTVPGQAGTDTLNMVEVSFTGYAFARGAGNPTPINAGCPCLLRGEIRLESEAIGTTAGIVTRSTVGVPGSFVGAPAASPVPAVATADRQDFSGSRVFMLAPGSYTFVMSVTREVGTATDVGFAFGNMSAHTMAFNGAGNRIIASPSPSPSATSLP